MLKHKFSQTYLGSFCVLFQVSSLLHCLLRSTFVLPEFCRRLSTLDHGLWPWNKQHFIPIFMYTCMNKTIWLAGSQVWFSRAVLDRIGKSNYKDVIGSMWLTAKNFWPCCWSVKAIWPISEYLTMQTLVLSLWSYLRLTWLPFSSKSELHCGNVVVNDL